MRKKLLIAIPILLILTGVTVVATQDDKGNYVASGDGSGVLKDSENVKDVEKKKPAKKSTAPTQNNIKKPQNYTVPRSDSPFVNRLNKIRIKSGLAPFRESDQLSAQAQAWSNNMARNGYRHSGYGGEVIAYSCGGYFEDVLQEWLDSPPHRAIIMGSGSTVGYGQVTKGDCTYYTGLVG